MRRETCAGVHVRCGPRAAPVTLRVGGQVDAVRRAGEGLDGEVRTHKLAQERARRAMEEGFRQTK